MTARRLKLFHERLGEQIANELVDWFNQVDTTYRADLRELNDLDFARFDAKSEQRLVTLESRIDQRFADTEVRLDQRFADTEVRLDQRFANAEVRLERRVAETESRLERRFATFESRITRWMFTFWTGTMLALAGFLMALQHSR